MRILIVQGSAVQEHRLAYMGRRHMRPLDLSWRAEGLLLPNLSRQLTWRRVVPFRG